MESPKSSNKINISKSDVTWSYIAQFFNVGAQVLILPMVLRILSPDMYGVWSLFIAIGGFVILLDFGFQTIFTRSVSYAFSGITVLLKEGIDPDAPVMNEPNYRLLKSLIKYMRRFYGLMSLFMLLILATAGTYYIYTVSSHLDNWGEILLAWGIFVFSTVFGFCFLYFRPLFLGRGLLKENNILIIVNKSVYIICAIIGLKLGYGIVAIPLALGLGEVVNRICAYFVFNRGGMKNILKETQSYEKKIHPIIWHNASRLGIAEVSIYFTMREGCQMIAALFLPLSVIGQYGITFQIIMFLWNLSYLYFHAHVPLLTQYRVENNKNGIVKIFGESVFVMGVTFLTGALGVIFLGDYIFDLFESKTHLLPTLPTILLFIIYFLGLNHTLSMVLLATKNRIPYFYSSLAAGIVVVVLLPLLVGVFNWGIFGIILAVGLVQISYQNWKWPLEVSRDLNIKYVQLYKIGFRSLKEKLRINK